EVGPDPAIRITPAQLVKEYASNPEAADAKYKGKQLFVEGVVDHVVDKSDIIYAIVEGAVQKDGHPVEVAIGFTGLYQLKQGANVKKGDRIRAKGRCAGFFLGDLTIWYSRPVK